MTPLSWAHASSRSKFGTRSAERNFRRLPTRAGRGEVPDHLQRGFDRGGGDVLPVGVDDDLLLPVRQRQVPLDVDVSDVAGQKPAVPVEDGRRLVLLPPVAARHHVRALREDLAVARELQAHAGDRLPDRAEAPLAGPVAGEDRARLRQPVALVDLHPRGPEEGGDLLGERRSSRNGEAEAPAEARADLLEDEPVRDRRADPDAERRNLAPLLGREPPLPGGDAPPEDRPPERRRLLHGALDAGEHLLVDARDGGEAVGLHLLETLREPVEGLRVRDRRRAREVEVVDHPLEDVGERQERERHVAGPDVEERRAGRHVRDDVPVRQDGSLRLARRAGGVDHRRPVAALDRGGALLEGGLVHAEGGEPLPDDGLERRRLLLAPGRRLHDEDVLQVPAPFPHVEDLLELDRIRDDDDLRHRVLQDVLDLRSEVRGVDRHRDRTEGQRREVGHRPLGPVLGEDRDTVVPVDAEEREPEGEAARRLGELRGGDVRPDAVLLRDEKVRLPARRGVTEVVEKRRGRQGVVQGDSPDYAGFQTGVTVTEKTSGLPVRSRWRTSSSGALLTWIRAHAPSAPA